MKAQKYFKAVTFSYDDGVRQDIRLSEVFNRYNIKATFNISSNLHSPETDWVTDRNVLVQHLNIEDIETTYKNHEIACHTCNHPHLKDLDEQRLREEIEQDRERLEREYRTQVVGMAYPFGEYDKRTIEILKENRFLYARTTKTNHNFEPQTNLLEFEPTCHHNDECIFELAEDFLKLKADTPKIFYIWGHSYEFEHDNNWDRIEKLCELLSGKDDIFYGTNREVFGWQKGFGK